MNEKRWRALAHVAFSELLTIGVYHTLTRTSPVAVADIAAATGFPEDLVASAVRLWQGLNDDELDIAADQTLTARTPEIVAAVEQYCTALSRFWCLKQNSPDLGSTCRYGVIADVESDGLYHTNGLYDTKGFDHGSKVPTNDLQDTTTQFLVRVSKGNPFLALFRKTFGSVSKRRETDQLALDVGVTSPSPERAGPPPSPSEQVRAVFEDWQRVMNYPHRRLTPMRRKTITARLRDGFTREQFMTVLTWAAAQPFYRGQNDRGRAFDDVPHLFGSTDKFERNLDHARRGHSRDLRLLPSDESEAREF